MWYLISTILTKINYFNISSLIFEINDSTTNVCQFIFSNKYNSFEVLIFHFTAYFTNCSDQITLNILHYLHISKSPINTRTSADDSRYVSYSEINFSPMRGNATLWMMDCKETNTTKVHNRKFVKSDNLTRQSIIYKKLASNFFSLQVFKYS